MPVLLALLATAVTNNQNLLKTPGRQEVKELIVSANNRGEVPLEENILSTTREEVKALIGAIDKASTSELEMFSIIERC